MAYFTLKGLCPVTELCLHGRFDLFKSSMLCTFYISIILSSFIFLDKILTAGTLFTTYSNLYQLIVL